MLVGFLLLVVQIVTMTAWAESNVRKTPEGVKLLNTLSSAGLFFLRWRAFADCKSELRSLQKIMGALALISIGLFSIVPEESKQAASIYPVAFMVLWMSIKVGIDVRGQFGEMMSMAVILFCVPLIVLFCKWLGFLPAVVVDQVRMTVPVMRHFVLQDYQFALILAFLFGITGVIMAVFQVLFFSIIPLMLLFLMVLVSKLSRNLLGWSTSRARNCVAVYVLFLGPTLFFLHAYHFI
ncbi:hypothetical protein DM813_28265 [Pseudomonas alkylphenolica]|uniref:Uncharacterized protein n=1 Tax=Pseudomonas alkylphenolica TaxID=237609 RepID=A0A443ZEW7_9PSED|nr:hypothetical protein [Pseudomonas alkylphenolica]RWU17256.1 hypothetical protein DM813_28265 [Pseudomonas alkylphenolica]